MTTYATEPTTTHAGISETFADAPAAVRAAAAAAQHLYDTPEWFTVERAAGTDPRLAWAISDSGQVAYATLTASRPSDPAWPYARPDLLLPELAASDTPADGLMPAVLIGGRRPGHSSIVIPSGSPDTHGVAADLLSVITEHAHETGASSLVAPFVDHATGTHLARAVGSPSLRVRAGRGWTLRLPGTGFKDWLASLAKKARVNERATIRRLELFHELDFEARPLQADDIDWMVPLELALYGRHGNDYGAGPARQLHEAYLDVLGDQTWVITATADGAPVGFASFIQHEDRAWIRQVGVAPGWEMSQVYFGVAYHGAIRLAYDLGVHSLDYSITADDAKRRRGAHSRELFSLITPLGRTHLTLRPGYPPVFA